MTRQPIEARSGETRQGLDAEGTKARCPQGRRPTSSLTRPQSSGVARGCCLSSLRMAAPERPTMTEQPIVTQREAIARIIDPDAWLRRERFQQIIRGEGRMPEAEEMRAVMVRSAHNRVDAVVEPSLAKADAILATLSPSNDEAILSDACRPWEHSVGDPPDYYSPLSQVFCAGLNYGAALFAKMLAVEDYEWGDGSEDYDSDATRTFFNIMIAAGYGNDDGDLEPPATPQHKDEADV